MGPQIRGRRRHLPRRRSTFLGRRLGKHISMTEFPTRWCGCCEQKKSARDFYASRKDKCRECVKEQMRLNRVANADRCNAYDRTRYIENPDRRENNARRRKVHAADGRMRAWRTDWINRNPEARRAHLIVAKAKSEGRLVPQPCEVCGTTDSIHAHHDDYSKPLSVRWLCVSHHAAHHVEKRSTEINDRIPF